MRAHRLIPAIVVLASTIVAAPPAQAARQRCKAKHSTTLASSTKVRIFAQGGFAKVCYKPTGKRFKLDDAFPGDDVFAAGGRFVAFSESDPEDDTIPEHSIVNVFRMPNGGTPKFLPYRTGAHVDDIVVKRNGAVAWTKTAGAAKTVEGMKSADHAPELLSDSARTVDTTSLVSGAGAKVRWDYTDGTAGSAMLFIGPADLS